MLIFRGVPFYLSKLDQFSEFPDKFGFGWFKFGGVFQPFQTAIFVEQIYIYNIGSTPQPSNSHHQNYYTLVANPNLNLHLPRFWRFFYI